MRKEPMHSCDHDSVLANGVGTHLPMVRRAPAYFVHSRHSAIC
jgi:hypothetical protein